MLGFRHPRPLHRKEVAMQVVQQESRAFSATELTVDLPQQPDVKKRRMPVCEFCIDAGGIERTTRQGHWMKGWDEVKAVRRYRRGYLVMFATGAIPIPFRCLTAEQQKRLRRLFSRRRGWAV